MFRLGSGAAKRLALVGIGRSVGGFRIRRNLLVAWRWGLCCSCGINCLLHTSPFAERPPLTFYSQVAITSKHIKSI